MATFEIHHSFLIRGIEASLRLEVGLSRGRIPAHEEGPYDFPPHQAFVGKPEEWDLVAARQVTLLLVAGFDRAHADEYQFETRIGWSMSAAAPSGLGGC